MMMYPSGSFKDINLKTFFSKSSTLLLNRESSFSLDSLKNEHRYWAGFVDKNQKYLKFHLRLEFCAISPNPSNHTVNVTHTFNV